MSLNPMNEDLRSVKTKNTLYNALFILLKKNSFRKMTVKEICEEALVSRAAFYSHFIDKYELLQQAMTDYWQKNTNNSVNYQQIEQILNRHIDDYALIIKNLFYDADRETYDILFNFILSIANLKIPKNRNEESYSKNVVLSNFYAGGVISYLLWHIKNRFPSDVPLVNKHLYEMMYDLYMTK